MTASNHTTRDFCEAVRSLGNNIVFSDEYIIRCTPIKGFCWVRPGSEEVTAKETNRWAANCHVWAAIGQNGFVAWVDVTGAPLCKKDYVEMIKSNFVVPCSCRTGPPFIGLLRRS